MRVDRATRADLGIWRRRSTAARPHARSSVRLRPTTAFGRTFSTDFTWDAAGDRLAVQSCGELACRIRVIDAGRRSDRDPRRPGPRADPRSRWRPCRDLRGLSGTPLPDRLDRPADRRSPGARAGRRTGRRHPDGRRCAARPRERARGASDGCGPSRPAAREPLDLGPIPDDLRLHPSSVRADAATSLPAGWVLLAQDGRLPADPADDRPQLRHVPDGSTVPLDEALR